MSCNFVLNFPYIILEVATEELTTQRDVIAQNDTQMANLVRESVSNRIYLCRRLVLPEFILYYNFTRNLHGDEESIV